MLCNMDRIAKGMPEQSHKKEMSWKRDNGQKGAKSVSGMGFIRGHWQYRDQCESTMPRRTGHSQTVMLRCCRPGATADETSPRKETCASSHTAPGNGRPSHPKVLVFQIHLSSCILLFLENGPTTSLPLAWSTPVSWQPHAGKDQPPTCR